MTTTALERGEDYRSTLEDVTKLVARIDKVGRSEQKEVREVRSEGGGGEIIVIMRYDFVRSDYRI